MLHEAGVVGSVSFLLSLTVAFLLHKHLGGILETAKAALLQKARADEEVTLLLSNIAQTNALILERVEKLPSDSMICKMDEGKAEMEALTNKVAQIESQIKIAGV